MRPSLSDPVSAIWDAVRYLDAAVSAHNVGRTELASALFRLADLPEIRRWTKSIWASNEVHVRARSGEPTIAKELRIKARMPSAREKALIHARDGYHCRFCSMPVVRSETRRRITAAYPQTAQWGQTEIEQHAAFQAMWAQYDHVVPHARGGGNELDNLVLTCAPCNFGRGSYTLAEVEVADPRTRAAVQSNWDGLERFT